MRAPTPETFLDKKCPSSPKGPLTLWAGMCPQHKKEHHMQTQSNSNPTRDVHVYDVNSGIRDVVVVRDPKTSERVDFVPRERWYGIVRADKAVVAGVWGLVCSLAFEIRPDHQIASGDAKSRAKKYSKALRKAFDGWRNAEAKRTGEDLPQPAAFASSASIVGRAIALHGMDGILAETDPLRFFGRTFVATRDKPKGSEETADEAFARAVKAYAPHAGSRIPAGSGGSRDDVQALAVACLLSLGMSPGIVDPDGADRGDYDAGDGGAGTEPTYHHVPDEDDADQRER